jgi:hypothetical protein
MKRAFSGVLVMPIPQLLAARGVPTCSSRRSRGSAFFWRVQISGGPRPDAGLSGRIDAIGLALGALIKNCRSFVV